MSWNVVGHQWVDLENFLGSGHAPPNDDLVVMAAFMPGNSVGRFYLGLAAIEVNDELDNLSRRRLLSRKELTKFTFNGTCWGEKTK